jgi:hypothetical protein
MARMELLPAEKMLAAVDPGYSFPAVLSLLDTRVDNGSVQFIDGQADLPYGVVYGEILSDLFFDSWPVKEFRKKNKLARCGGTRPLVAALLKAWKDFGGKRSPRIGILEFHQPFSSFESHEYELLAGVLGRSGLEAQMVSPDQLEFRGGVLRRGEFEIDMVYRGVRAHEFLLRYDLGHPLMRAYRERAVCVVNSFQTEMTRKKSLLALLTDESVTAGFPLAERKAILESIPWTRMVSQTRTTWNGQSIDLPAFIANNRQTLTLRPNDSTGELPTVEGSLVDDAQWNRALKQALRSSYVVQQALPLRPMTFPVDFYGDLVYRDLNVDVTPQSFLGKIQGASARISAAQPGFSSISGMAPLFVLESR